MHQPKRPILKGKSIPFWLMYGPLQLSFKMNNNDHTIYLNRKKEK